MTLDWKNQIRRLTDQGASYADVRYYPKEEEDFLLMWNGNLLAFNRSETSGFGVRVLADGAWGFAASSSLNDIQATFDRALENARAAAGRLKRPIRLADKEAVKGCFDSPCQTDPFEIPLEDKLALMKELDGFIDQPGVQQRRVMISTSKRTVHYYDSEGAEIEKRIIDIFPSIQVAAMDADGVQQERKYLPPRLGPSRGWETMDRDHWQGEAERIVREMNQLLTAPACPKDRLSVILLPDMMYLQVHETIGHPLELDRILGYELSYAGGSFVRLEDFGKLQYGSKKLNARADATLINSPGSFGYDDDGVPAQNRMLIDQGILVGALTSRQMVTEANDKAGRQLFDSSGGACRACDFNRVPLERMTNINIDPGEDGSLEDIIKGTEKGLLLSGDKSWSIGSNREQFHFATDIGWLIEDGEQKHVLKNCSYSGMTLEFYRSLSAVGDESTWQVQYVDNCGKGVPGQVMQLGHGVPVCRFDHVKVGD
ncbi:MAG TPA: TldD/PmbA family protein [Bacillota bacterium]|jgi:TldD protein|nr:TldD/PmbA family protein [Fastidiosipila sp.]HPX92615.1 TldD/PmbA family protein [Bacillota bacterium]HQB81117.1 TldD/PmbA family protein [Bacillota bacterium]